MGSDPCCKVGEVIERYPLERSIVGGDIDDYLVARWLGESTYPETSIRGLTDWFNTSLLKAVYSEHGRSATETRIESEYHALDSDDDIRRGEVLDDLHADGIDGDALVSDFVSASTLYRHVTDCLGARKESGSETPAQDSTWEREKVEYARATAMESVEAAVQSLDNKNRIPNGSTADVEVAVELTCPVCSTRVRFETALERGFVCREHMGARDDASAAGGDGDEAAAGGEETGSIDEADREHTPTHRSMQR